MRTDAELEKRRTQKRLARLAKRGGCTPDQKAKMIADQGGKCAICERYGLELFVDHCHSTEKVRSALCRNCNLALGHAKDHTAILGKMIEYLEGHRGWEWDYFRVYGSVPDIRDLVE